MDIRVSVNTADTARAFARLQARAPQAIVRALNRSVASATTLAVRLISQDTGIKRADLVGTTRRNQRIWTSEATTGHPVAYVEASLARIPLADFRAKGPTPSRGKGRGVTARVQGGSRRYPHLFLARMASGHVGVFGRVPRLTGRSARAWSPNLPIAERYGPSVVHVFEQHTEAIKARAEEQLVKNLQSEFKFAMSQGA